MTLPSFAGGAPVELDETRPVVLALEPGMGQEAAVVVAGNADHQRPGGAMISVPALKHR